MSALGQVNKEAPQLRTEGWKRTGRQLTCSEQGHLGEEE